MTTWSRPWAGTTTGDAGPYSDGQWAAMYRLLFGGDHDARGVIFSTQNGGLQVIERGAGVNMSVDVVPGQALVAGRVYYSDATQNVAIAAADPTLNRIDYVVLRSDAANQLIEVHVKTGTPAASPVPPSLDVSGSPYFEIPLARVYVGAAVSAIYTGNISDARSFVNLPLRLSIYVNNTSGVELFPHEVVVWDDAATNSVKTTTTADDPNIAGVVDDIIPIGGSGRICVLGTAEVLVDGAVGIGDVLCASSSAKFGTNQGTNSIGRMLQATSGLGVASIFVDAVSPKPAFAQAAYEYTGPLSSSTWTTLDATNLSHTITTSGGAVDLSLSLMPYQGAGASVQGAQFDVLIDGTTQATTLLSLTAAYGLLYTRNKQGNEYIQRHSIHVRISGLAPGSHTFTLQGKRDASPGYDVYFDGPTVFTVEEVIR